MKICIWCNKTERTVTFNKAAHTIPQSLGGARVCENVCDDCNHFFGSPTPTSPSIEVVFKEILIISKYILFDSIHKRPKRGRFKSEYFNLNLDKKKLSLKPRYKLTKGFQEKLGILFKRGLYKVYLEERECQKNDALDDRFNFIREFARYGLGNYPIYYFIPKFGGVFFLKKI